MALIFLASTSLGSASNTSLIVRPVLLWLLPHTGEDTINFIHLVLIRKGAHFTEYAVLALLAARAFKTSSRKALRDHWFLAALLLVAVYSLSDEFHQSFVASRTASIYDSMIDSLGGLVALTIGWIASLNRRGSMLDKFRRRSYELENLDKGTYTAEEYEGSLVELRRVNRFLGDARALRRSLFREIERAGLKSFSVLDVGAGSGELLRVTARWAGETQRSARLCGLELNTRSASAIIEESREFPEISSVQADGFAAPFSDRAFDYVIQSLTLHHFDDDGAARILSELSRVARRGICVIDLHRNPVAYYFFTTVGRLFLHNRLIREDGALSILRSFKPDELKALGDRAGLANVKVERHFPYRLVLSSGPITFTTEDTEGFLQTQELNPALANQKSSVSSVVNSHSRLSEPCSR